MEKEKILIQRIGNGKIFEKEDVVAVEQQMDVVLSNGKCMTVTCTPSNVEEMVLAKKYLARDFETKALQEYVKATENAGSLKVVDPEEIFAIARDSFETPGPLFTETGCAHACALIYQGKAVCCIEDIGRHNALDKIIGYAVLNHIPMSECYVFTSGRISGDYLQKVIDAGFPMVVSRAAVTEKAVKLAKEAGITMLGFIRKNTGNIYHEGTVKICAAEE